MSEQDNMYRIFREFNQKVERLNLAHDTYDLATMVTTMHALIMAVEELRVRVRMLENAQK